MSSTVLTFTTAESRAIRDDMLQRLIDAAGGDAGMFYSVSGCPGGRIFDEISTVGDADLRRHFEPCAGKEVFAGASAASDPSSVALRRDRWTLEQAPRRCREGFTTLGSVIHLRDLVGTPAHSCFYGPLEVRDHLRTLVFEGRRFLGWAGVLRRHGSRPFSARDEARTNRHRKLVGESLLAARAVTAWTEGLEREASALFDPRGRLTQATPAAARWMNRECREVIGRVVRRLDSGAEPQRLLLDGVKVHLVRLDGTGGPVYLATLTGPRPLLLSPLADLTPRQRTVAELAAVGATVVEIAQQLDLSSNTVRFHLKSVYARLEVASRVELAAALRTAPASSAPG